MNVNRRMPNGAVNPYEPHQAQFWMTSAAEKSTYGYEKLLELFELSIIDPRQAFVWGCSYQVPMLHNLISPQYINEIRTSQTFKTESWAKEYCSIWVGGSTESWFNYERMTAHRKLVNPETHANFRVQGDFFYLISVDILLFTYLSFLGRQ